MIPVLPWVAAAPVVLIGYGRRATLETPESALADPVPTRPHTRSRSVAGCHPALRELMRSWSRVLTTASRQPDRRTRYSEFVPGNPYRGSNPHIPRNTGKARICPLPIHFCPVLEFCLLPG